MTGSAEHCMEQRDYHSRYRAQRSVPMRSLLHQALIGLFLCTFLGQGSLVRGLTTLFASPLPSCCLTGQHCPLARAPQARTHDAHCPLEQQRPAVHRQCQLRSCTHHQTAAQPPDSLLRFVLPAVPALSASETDFSVENTPPFFWDSVGFSPPDPPPRALSFRPA